MKNFSLESFETLLAMAWNGFKMNFFRIIGLFLLMGLLMLVGYLIAGLIGFGAFLMSESSLTAMVSIPLAVMLGLVAVIAVMMVIVPFVLSWVKILLKIVQNEKPKMADLWFGFAHKKKSFFLLGTMILKMTPWYSIIPFIISFGVLGALQGTDMQLGGFIFAGITFFAIVIESFWRMAKYNLLPYLVAENPENKVRDMAEKSATMMNGSKWYYILIIVVVFFAGIIIQLPFSFFPEESSLPLLSLLLVIPFNIFTMLLYPAFYVIMKELKSENTENTEN